MATAAKNVVCSACGYKNASTAARCVSCGASMESGGGPKSRVDPARARGQTGFSILWCLIAFVVLGVLTGALVIGLPMVVTALDFEGSYGMTVSIPVWFLGGLLVGMISPGRTFIEPVVAALFVSLPTAIFLAYTQTVRTLPPFMYAILALIGVMFTLVGSYLGERIQMGPPPKVVD
ncbi:MAG: hypothetical protein U0271_12145 [Polyangiaceae bacterium]